MCNLKFESNKICEDFKSKKRDDYFSPSNEKFKYSFCDRFQDCLCIQHMIVSLVSEYKIWNICNLRDNTFCKEKKVKINHFLKYSSLNIQNKFVLFVFYTVLTCQTRCMYNFLTKETASALCTSVFHMKIDLLISLSNLRVDNFF